MIAQPSSSSGGSYYWLLLKWIIFVLVVIFVAHRATELWSSAPEVSIHFSGVWLIPAALLYIIGWLPSVGIWKDFLQAVRQPVGWWDVTRAYFVGHLGKYIPGKALVLVIRGSMVRDAGVDPILGGLTAAFESLLFMAVGAEIGAAMAPFVLGESFWTRAPTWLHWLRDYPLLVPLSVVVFAFGSTPLTARLLTGIARKSRPRGTPEANSPRISAALVSKGVVTMSLGWACHALSLGFVIQSVSPEPFDITQFPMWLATCAISTFGGFVVLIAPGGFGVREGILIELLKNQPQIGAMIAVVVAGLLRCLWFGTELILAAVLYFVGGKHPQTATDQDLATPETASAAGQVESKCDSLGS